MKIIADNESLIKIKKWLKLVPLSHVESIIEIEFRPLSPLSKKLNGMHIPFLKKIVLYKLYRQTLLHEIGHHVAQKIIQRALADNPTQPPGNQWIGPFVFFELVKKNKEIERFYKSYKKDLEEKYKFKKDEYSISEFFTDMYAAFILKTKPLPETL